MTVLIVLFVINLIGLLIDIGIRINQMKNTNAARKEIEYLQMRSDANMVILQEVEQHMKKCGARTPKNQLELILTRVQSNHD